MPNTAKFILILVTLMWGANYTVMRWGIESVDPITMTALRFFLSAVLIIFFVKRPNIPMSIVVLYGMLFGGGIWGLISLAIAFNTPAGMTALLFQVSVFLSFIVAFIVFNEAITK